MIIKKCGCILVYGNTTKGDVVKRSDCILVYGNTTKSDVVKRSDCILVTTKGDVVKRSDCILVYGSTTKGDVVKRSDYIKQICKQIGEMRMRTYQTLFEKYKLQFFVLKRKLPSWNTHIQEYIHTYTITIVEFMFCIHIYSTT